MRALLDTNIVIHRETDKVRNQSIGTLFKWLDKANYEKCIHPITIDEIQRHEDKEKIRTLNIKLESYTRLKTIAKMAKKVQMVSDEYDKNPNDLNDTKLLNEVYQGRVDILISEDKRLRNKASKLGILDQVFSINGFLEKVISENPGLLNYDVLSVTKKYFGNINLCDTFFDTFRSDYSEFNLWFNKKADETAYVSLNKERLLAFLYLKLEDKTENYNDISPLFSPKRRLKIGTFKVASNGLRLGERFLEVIFDNALKSNVEEIYVTAFDKSDEQNRLLKMLEDWGFKEYGIKNSINGKEKVLVRKFTPDFILSNPQYSFPFISLDQQIYLCSIYPEYQTELFPDSILTTESKMDFKEHKPHRNALKKVFISRSINRNLKPGDIILFYRTGGYYKGVVTTLGLVEGTIIDIKDEEEFILKCRKRSVFTDAELKHWFNEKNSKPFIVNFLYTYTFPKRLNLAKLIELGVTKDTNSAPRGFELISMEKFWKIFKGSHGNESIIVN